MAENTIQDMTRSELRALIREVLIEVLEEVGGQPSDPDEGLAFRPEIAERLRVFLRDKPQGEPVEDIARELGLNV
jgi:hypothetical protein